ncbi:HAD family hydrolase [Eubacteriales bacterium OttesenSCG-928-N14]|nr:HAD family hydrolase [Eubacteriales bacterium OttesenSCG-928-N14]
MSIKLIAVDLDGTLLEENTNNISEKDLRAIVAAQERGIIICPCTGRTSGEVSFLYDTGILRPGMAAQCNGAVITKAGEIMVNFPLPIDIVNDILRHVHGLPVVPMYFGNEQVYLFLEDLDRVWNHYGKAVFSLDSIREDYYSLAKDMMDFTTNHDEQIIKLFLLLSDTSQREQIAKFLGGMDEIDYFVVKSEEIEIVRKGINKASALQYIADHYGISKDEIMAIGDSPNDIEMLQWAGTSVAVNNASQQVKQVCDHIVAERSSGGVSEAIYRYAL